MLRRTLVPGLVLLAVLAATATQADLLFDARRDFYAGDWPRDVAIGDFNGDNHQDMAVPLYDDEEMAIFLGNGDGTFQEVVTYGTCYSLNCFPFSAAVGRINADVHDDVVVANWGAHTIGTHLGIGDGTFAVVDTQLIGGGPNCVILSDLNEDTVLDVVTANWHGDDITIGLGNGDGTFTPAPVPLYPVGEGPYSVAAGDFNEDDDLDLVVANFWDDDLSILLGSGDGSFSAPDSLPSGKAPHDFGIADFNDDDHLDLVVPCRDDDEVWVYFGQGDGTFPTTITLPTGHAPYSVVVGDFNGDDDPDIAACCRYDYIVDVYLGDGAGGFGAGASYGVGEEPYSMAVGDFDEDTIPDIAVACREEEGVSILFGRGDGTFMATPWYDAGLGPSDVVVADFDGDQNPDVAVAAGTSEQVGILLGNGDGTFVYDAGYGAGDSPSAIVAGHFDGDQHIDLASAAGNDRRISVFLGDGDGTFSPGTGFDIPFPFGLVCAELDGRGSPDLIVAGGTARQMYVYTGNGDGTFTSAGSCTTGGSMWWTARSPAIGDFDGDQIPDMAVPVGEYSVSQMTILLGNGDGTFEFDGTYLGDGRGGGLADAGDFDQDGHLDVVMANQHSNDVSIFLGNGDGTLQPAIAETVGLEPWDVAAKDFDGDGFLDILAACSSGWTGVALLLGNGDGTFEDPDPYGTGTGTFYLDVGDLNSDSRMDAVVGSPWSDQVSVLMNIGPNTPVEQSFYATATGDGSVMVRWLLSSFDDARAVRLYRATSFDGPFEFLAEQTLPDASSGEFRDETTWPGATFWYDLRAVLHDGSEASFVQFLPSVTVGGSLHLAMRAPTPNPFASQCSFSIDIPNHDGGVRLDVYNVRGQLVRTLLNEPLPAGRYSVNWDGRDAYGRQAASGVYFMRLGAGQAHVEEKAILLR